MPCVSFVPAPCSACSPRMLLLLLARIAHRFLLCLCRDAVFSARSSHGFVRVPAGLLVLGGKGAEGSDGEGKSTDLFLLDTHVDDNKSAGGHLLSVAPVSGVSLFALCVPRGASLRTCAASYVVLLAIRSLLCDDVSATVCDRSFDCSFRLLNRRPELEQESAGVPRRIHQRCLE